MIKKIEDALNEVDILVIMGPVNDKDILKAILREHFRADIHFGISFFSILIRIRYGVTYLFARAMLFLFQVV